MLDTDKKFTVLLPIALPSSGKELLKLAVALTPPNAQPSYHALHLAEPDSGSNASDPIEPIIQAAQSSGIRLHTISFESDDVPRDIAAVTDEIAADLVLLGWFDPLTDERADTSLSHRIMKLTKADVAVYLCRFFKPWQRVLVPFFGGPHDLSALRLAGNIAARGEANTTILHVVPVDRSEDERIGLKKLGDTFGFGSESVKIIQTDSPIDAAVNEAKLGYDLVIIGASQTWGLDYHLFDTEHERLAFECPASLLVVRKMSTRNGAKGTGAKNQIETALER